MKITDEIRTHAQTWYGPRADDYLAAAERARHVVAGHKLVGEIEARRSPPFGTAEDGWVEGPEFCGSAADARLRGWDTIFSADAVEFGWVSCG